MLHRIFTNRLAALAIDVDGFLRLLRERRCRAALALLMACYCSLPVMAADFYLRGVDMKACSYWNITVLDDHPAGLTADGNGQLKRPHWMIMAAQDMARHGDAYVSAPCLFDEYILIYCQGELPFPMAGATYRNLVKSNQDPVYQCSKGCDRSGVLPQVFDMSGENVHPSKWRFADQINAYEKHCAGRLDANGFLKEPKSGAH